MKTRRDFLKTSLGALFLAKGVSSFASVSPSRFVSLSRASWKIGICDWDLRATGQPSSFALAKELGFEGVQVTYQPEGADSLADNANRTKFLEAAKESGVGIASFCIGLLNNRPLATTPEAERWVEECVETMVAMNIDQTLIPFFAKADIYENKEQLPVIIDKFKRVAPVAAKNKKKLAIESYLSAEDLLKVIDTIGSNAVTVYYDVCNSLNKSYDIYQEMELLGKNKLISQIHFKEDRRRLGEGDINFTRVCEILDKTGYDGWVVVESSTSGDWRESQMANAQFIKKLIR